MTFVVMVPRGHNEIIRPDTIECVAGQGIVGDRYFGFKENFKGQITFFDYSVFEKVKSHLVIKNLMPVSSEEMYYCLVWT